MVSDEDDRWCCILCHGPRFIVGPSQKSKSVTGNVPSQKCQSIKGAEGPTIARALAEQHYANETYVMGVDSHCHFVRGWDNVMIDMFHRIGELRGIARFESNASLCKTTFN